MAGSSRKIKKEIKKESHNDVIYDESQGITAPRGKNRRNNKSALRLKKKYAGNFGLHCNDPAEKILIVYTKRIDEMEIVLNPRPVTSPAKFFEKILAESKPQIHFNSFKNIKSRAKIENGPMSYVKLKYKIDRVNKTVARKLLRIKRKQEIEMKNGTQSETDLSALKKSMRRKTYLKTEIKTTDDSMKEIKCRIHYLIFRDNYLILKNLKTNEAEVYFLDNKGMVIQHYQTNNDRHNLFQRSLKTTEIPYCCWYQRKDFISLFNIPPISMKYIDSAHRCKGQCSCCCPHLLNNNILKVKKSKKSITEEAVNIPQQMNADSVEVNLEIIVPPAESKVLIENMLNKPPTMPPISSLIKKAFAFNLPDKTTQKTHNVKNDNIIKGTQILFNYKDGNEYYKIGLEGEISQHLRNVSQTFIEDYVVSGENTINKTICCWFSRENVIHLLRKNKILPNTLRYMRTRHTCFVDSCVCCCAPVKVSGRKTNNFKRLTLPEFSNYTTEVYTELPPLKFAFASFEPAAYDDFVPINAILPQYNQTVCKEINNVSNSPKCILKNPSIQSIVNEDSENGNVQVDKNEEDRRRAICANAAVLLGSKINKLKNVSVHINEKVKITAVLNIPVTELSNEELKILSSILTQAQKDIDAPKQFSPTCSNSVNTSNKIDQNLQNRQGSIPQRNRLYAAFSNWSSIHRYECLKSLKSFLHRRNTSKLRKYYIATKEQKKHVNEPSKKRSYKKPPQQTQELLLAKKHNRTKSVNKLVQTQTEIETLETTKKKRIAKRKTTEKLKIKRKSMPSDDSLGATPLALIATNSFVSDGNLSVPAVETHSNPLELDPIYGTSENENVKVELTSLPIDEASTATTYNPDSILGA